MDDITIEELKALVAENSRAISRQEKLQAERAEQWQEELRASRQQWQEELAASRQQWREELAASRREHDRLIANIERSMDNLNRQLGNLGNRVGELNEAAFYPSLERVLREDFHMDVIAPNVRARRQGEELELDMLAYANEEVNTVFDVEIKTELDQEARRRGRRRPHRVEP